MPRAVAPGRSALPPPVPPPTVLTRPDDDPTAATLLAAAVEVMAVNGYHGSSVRDIASAAGTSPAVLYHHYASKQGLLVTLCDRGLDLLLRTTEDALDDAGHEPAQRLDAIVGAHVRFHMDSQRESLIGNSELRALEPAERALVIAKRDAQERLFDRVVRDGTREGVFTTAHPRDAARFVVTACTGVAGWYRPGGALHPEQVVARHRAIALDAVGHRR